MKNLKKLAIIIIIFLFIIYVSTVNIDFQLHIKRVVLGILTLLTFIFHQSSVAKFKSIFRLNIKSTTGLIYCMAAIPLITSAYKNVLNPYRFEDLLISISIFLLLIFNYGIKE